MPRPAPAPHRSTTLLAAGVALALAVAAVPASASASASAAVVPAHAEVVLALRPATPLDTARAPQSAAERTARAARSAPSAATRAQVRRWLTGHGFVVRAGTGWTVRASGPASLLTPRLPAALRGSVLSAVRLGPSAMRPRAVPVGYGPPPLREAYGVSGNGRGTTVATIQFSGWRSSDAAVFARAAGIVLEPGQLRTESVLGAAVDRPDGAGGDFEAALDVQAVLGAAPAARQRVFVAPNSTSGAIAVYDAVATAAERDGLTAVSISWGACEARTAPALMAALEQSLARMVAAGATVTAASGDAGAYGCAGPDRPDGRLSVDYPASSPHVLGVGGTSLRRTATGWAEVAWSDRSDGRAGYAGQGTGGGLSARFAQPAWQRARVSDTRRAVPDLAAVADPRTGLGVYGPDADGRRGWQLAGGTSAAAPVVAGQLAAAASRLGRTTGFGSVHVPLYAATSGLRDVVRGDNLRWPAGPGYDLATGLGTPQWATLAPHLLEPALLVAAATREPVLPVAAYAPGSPSARYAVAETPEQACAAAGSPRLPTTLALGDGPDRSTAAVLAVLLDGTCRTTSRPVVLDRTGPVVHAGLSRSGRPGVLALSWGAVDPAPGSGVAAVSWRVRRADTGAVVATGTARGAGALLRTLPRGVPLRLEVSAVDAVGNRSDEAHSGELTG